MKKIILNSIRKIFCYAPFRNILRRLTNGKSPHSIIGRIAPPNFLFAKNSITKFNAEGFIYELDLSDYIGHYLYFGFEDDSLSDLYNRISDGAVIFDIGANIGSTAMHFATCAKNTTVYGFEPDAHNFKIATNNIKLNNFKNITLYNFGLGDKKMQSKLFIKDDNNRGMNRILNDEKSELSYSVIDVNTLDDVVEEIKPTKIDVIKIDVEGFEMKVLTGAKNTLLKFKPKLFLETNNSLLANHQSSISDVVQFLITLNYKLSIIPGNNPLTDDDIKGANHFDLFAEQN